MIKKSIFLLFFVLISAAVILFVLNNSSSVDVAFAPATDLFGNASYELKNINLGVVVICSVVVGFLLAWLFAGFLLFKGLIQRKKVEYDVKRKEKFIDSILTAREASAEENWTRANSEWQKLKKQDPSKVLSNVEISKVLEGENKIQSALKVIDQARAAAPKNIEVLFRAAELNLANNNKTAALDNLALVLSTRSSQKAAIIARDLSEELNRLDDSLEYNEKALEAGTLADYDDAKSRLKLKKIIAEAQTDNSIGINEYRKELKGFVKQNKSFEGGYVALAQLEESEGNIEKAAEVLFKASQIKGNQDLWHHSVNLWLDQNAPDKALATAKTAAKSTTGKQRLQAELDLIKINLALSKIDAAKELINKFPALVESEEIESTDCIKKDFIYLKGLCLNRAGLHQAEAELWISLSESKLDLDKILNPNNNTTGSSDMKQLSPKYSTP